MKATMCVELSYQYIYIAQLQNFSIEFLGDLYVHSDAELCETRLVCEMNLHI